MPGPSPWMTSLAVVTLLSSVASAQPATPPPSAPPAQPAASTSSAPSAQPEPPLAPADATALRYNGTPVEQALHTAVPVYVELSDEVAGAVATVRLRYQPYGTRDFLTVHLPALRDGFGIELPCEVAKVVGPLRYYFELLDAGSDILATAGSAKEPLAVAIVSVFEGTPPSLPGQAPPRACVPPVCDPALDPACEEANAPGDSLRPHCEDAADCLQKWSCEAGRCVPPPPPPAPPRYQVGLLGTADSMVLARDQSAGFTAGRAVFTCERWLFPSVPLTAGVRFGYAFDGGPSDDPRSLAYEKGLSVEGRVAAHPMGMWSRAPVDPFFFLGGGIARARTPSPLPLGGPGFLSTGAGATFTVLRGLSITAELSLLLYMPELAMVIAPSVGPTYRF